jgi:hypothetical protein
MRCCKMQIIDRSLHIYIALSIFEVIPKGYGYLSDSKSFSALTICFFNLFVLLSDEIAL